MALIKLIDSSSFFSDEPTVTVIDFDQKGLIKQASDSRVSEFAASIKPDPDKIYVHILAMGAGEFFGANRNQDYFPENNLVESHGTFVTSPAHIFRNHVNKNPEIAIGQVIFSIYNERMHRVEVIAWIDKVKGADIVERLEHGNFPATSMACKTAYDTCSICGNKAHTLQEYCEHLRNQLGKIYPDGRKVMALNLAPLKFFDMSIVVRPADVTSSILQKLASNGPAVGSAEAAYSEGVVDRVEKKAEFKKLSELIKEIDGDIVSYDQALSPILARVVDPSLKLISVLKNFPLPEIASTFAELGISPSIAFLSELVAQATIGSHMAGCGKLVEDLVHEHGARNLKLPEEEDVSLHGPITKLASLLSPYMGTSSTYPQYVEYRSSHPQSYIKNTNVGYMGNGPYIESRPEDFINSNHGYGSNTKGLVRSLLEIGATALLVKWYITRKMELKIKEIEDANIHSGVKINLVKSASDYRVSYQLAKASMIRALQK